MGWLLRYTAPLGCLLSGKSDKDTSTYLGEHKLVDMNQSEQNYIASRHQQIPAAVHLDCSS